MASCAAVNQSASVQCPICQVHVLKQDINCHIDTMHVDAISDNHIDLPHLEDLVAEPNAKRQRASCKVLREESYTADEPAAAGAIPIAPNIENQGWLAGDSSASPTLVQDSDFGPQQTAAAISTAIAPDCANQGCDSPAVCHSSVPATLVQDSDFGLQQTCSGNQAGASLHASFYNRPNSASSSGKMSLLGEEVPTLCHVGAAEPAGNGSTNGVAEALFNIPCDTVTDLALQPDEHLRAHLIGSRAQALRDATNLSASMQAQSLQLCRDIERDVEHKRRFFEDYPKMSKPTNYEAQRARNRARDELHKVTGTALGNLRSLIDISQKPAKTLRLAQAAQLQKIQTAMDMLEALRVETISMFREREEEEKATHMAVEAATLAVAPSVDCLDCFVQHLTKEIDEESEKAMQVHTAKLEQLQQEQSGFVTANDSPQRNPMFAKVIQDIESTERVLSEHSSMSESHKSLVEAWEEVMEEFPRTRLQPKPQKSSVWGRLLGRM